MTTDERLDEIARRTRESGIPWREDIDAYRTGLTEAHALGRDEERRRCADVCRARADRFVKEAATMQHPFRKLLLLSDAGEAVYCANEIARGE